MSSSIDLSSSSPSSTTNQAHKNASNFLNIDENIRNHDEIRSTNNNKNFSNLRSSKSSTNDKNLDSTSTANKDNKNGDEHDIVLEYQRYLNDDSHKKSSPSKTGANDREDRPRDVLATTGNELTPELAIDCEMVEATKGKRRFSVLARISLVNSDCEPILDTYVYPMHPVSDYRTRFSGIKPRHLRNAPSYDDVRALVISLIRGRTLIGHDLIQDLTVLNLNDLPDVETRDTSLCYLSYFKPKERASLKRLAAAVLGRVIQTGAHDSMEDAKTAMELNNIWLELGNDDHTPPGARKLPPMIPSFRIQYEEQLKQERLRAQQKQQQRKNKNSNNNSSNNNNNNNGGSSLNDANAEPDQNQEQGNNSNQRHHRRRYPKYRKKVQNSLNQ